MSDPFDFFDFNQQQRIIAAIRAAEKTTSGEVRVHLDEDSGGHPVRKAIKVFRWLKMHKTQQRNGVLFYLAVKDHRFAVIGDRGINDKVPSDFWNSTRDILAEHFKRGAFVEGLERGIAEAGQQLAAHFPYQSDDVNELPDDISFGNAK